MTLEELRQKYKAGNDKELLDIERETHIIFDDEMTREGKCLIDSGQKSVIKSLMENKNFKLSDHFTKSEEVVYISGEIPLNCIRIKNKPTGKNTLHYILNH